MQKLLVTGAGGFLGGWVVECCLLSGIPVRAGIRRWNSAVRLARHAAEIVPCDVLSPDQLAAAMEGCDAVVHCAVGDQGVTVDGTRNVLAAAERLQLRRVVHLSSVAVYGQVEGTIDEGHPRRSGGNHYARCKIEAEKVCERYVARQVPIVVLRPSIIYGPFSETWTVSFAKRLMSGRWGTFGRQGEGWCNLVYVTDVVQAILRALEADAVVGECFHVNGSELITWNDYFRRFNTALQRDALPELRTWPLALKAGVVSPVRSLARLALQRFNKSIVALHARSSLAAAYMGRTESTLKLTPTRRQLRLYRLQARYSIDKAQRQLGFAPQVSIDQGLEWSVAWLRQQGLLDARV
jgi:nucleoside-diphosphate-sugar epimerase